MKTIRNLLLFAVTILGTTGLAYSQAKKPTIMVLPSDNWCIENGYSIEYDDQGTKVPMPDYRSAFQGSSELLQVVSALNGLMAERGFPLKNAESVLKSLYNQSAEDAMMTTKDGDGSTAESPIDLLKKTANADIIMQLTWTVQSTGPKKYITFNLQGLDSYSNKQVATAVGNGAPSFAADVPILLEEAVLAHIDKFNSDLQAHFDDMFENGREIVVRIKRFDSWDEDLESIYNGEELGILIEDWMADNTVKGRFSLTTATENQMFFEQVRIPLYNDRGRAIDARRFTKGLQAYLREAPFNITAKLTTSGLGQATIWLGGK